VGYIHLSPSAVKYDLVVRPLEAAWVKEWIGTDPGFVYLLLPTSHKARSLRTVRPTTGIPKVVLTEKDIAQGRERGKDAVQMLLERLWGKGDTEQK
jgi:hypothetical protein